MITLCSYLTNDVSDLKDGTYKLQQSTTSWHNINDIPAQENITNSVNETYPNFTTQTIEFDVRVLDGEVVLNDVLKGFPKNWEEFNTHAYVEDFYSKPDGTIGVFLGS